MINIKKLKVGNFVRHIPSHRAYKVWAISNNNTYQKNDWFAIELDFDETHQVLPNRFDEFEIVSRPVNQKQIIITVEGVDNLEDMKNELAEAAKIILLSNWGKFVSAEIKEIK